MQGEFSSININELLNDSFCIYPIIEETPIYKFLRKLKINATIIDNLYLLSIPEKEYHVFLEHYTLIDDRIPYCPPNFSLDDFILAYIATNYQWGIISYDHHLSETIHEFLDFQSYYPCEISLLPANEIVLLDTNILFLFSNQNDEKSEIIEMFLNNPSITFLISENILEETRKLYEHNHFEIKNQIDIYLKPQERSLARYIDNFDGFLSAHEERIRWKQFISKKTKRGYQNRWRGKWDQFL